VANEAGCDGFHLVGYSAGGASSVAFTASHPERLSSIALIEPAWMGNEGLSREEQAVRREFDRIATLPPDQMMPAFIANQLAPRVEPPPPAPGPPPPWMAKRPAGLRAVTTAFNGATLDLNGLRAFDRPVYFALGGQSNSHYYGRLAERAADAFPDFTLDVFEQRPPLRPAASDRAGADRKRAARSLDTSRALTVKAGIRNSRKAGAAEGAG